MDNATQYAIFLVVSSVLIIALLWLPDILHKD